MSQWDGGGGYEIDTAKVNGEWQLIDPATPAQVEQALAALSTEVEETTDAHGVLVEELGQVEADYRVALAHAKLAAEGRTQAERDARALLACEALLRDRERLRAAVRKAGEACRSVRARLDGGRSISASVRSAAQG